MRASTGIGGRLGALVAAALLLLRVLAVLPAAPVAQDHHHSASAAQHAPADEGQGSDAGHQTCHFCRQIDPALPPPTPAALVPLSFPVAVARAAGTPAPVHPPHALAQLRARPPPAIV